VTCIDSLQRERAVSVGYDRTARLWKVVEETQLLFKGSSTNKLLFAPREYHLYWDVLR
jgi:hypothetical protein